MNRSNKFGGVLCLVFLVINLFEANAQSGIQFPKKDSTTVSKEWPYVLPIWGQKVADRNIDLQLPFGFNINYVFNQMSLELTEFSMNFFDGENLDDLINPETLNFTETVATTNGVNLRADAWILPFLNFYGIYSKNQGTTKVSFQPQVVENNLGPNGNLKEITTLEKPIDVPAVTFNTNSFGMGTTLVYGWDNYFVSMDGNVTWTTSDLLTQTVTFFVGSARIGRRVTFRNKMKLAVYIGAMYRDFVNKENNTGSIGVPELDEAMLRAIDAFSTINNEQIVFWESLPDATPGKDEKLAELYARENKLDSAADRVENSDTINYSIKKEIIDNWSTQIGFNFEISNNWMYRAELGYRDNQKFFMTGLQYRFGL
ncbi:hypothetical protein [Algibacter mikhailovii]|uniref:Porin n=1 Tax=Algibacter mikhailovii TaxID=425498 RepID=A0A918QQG3_9FLAO|nr:hypothetical protein [Algibacter mikhailovii]GGZ67628.1 hypothetical protein GCM10007028_00640 [Algibacter mikhailovii]